MLLARVRSIILSNFGSSEVKDKDIKEYISAMRGKIGNMKASHNAGCARLKAAESKYYEELDNKEKLERYIGKSSGSQRRMFEMKLKDSEDNLVKLEASRLEAEKEVKFTESAIRKLESEVDLIETEYNATLGNGGSDMAKFRDAVQCKLDLMDAEARLSENDVDEILNKYN